MKGETLVIIAAILACLSASFRASLPVLQPARVKMAVSPYLMLLRRTGSPVGTK